ncbi:MAG: hypothetical protein WAL22_02895 [Solirubrobacteraceae bacterium]
MRPGLVAALRARIQRRRRSDVDRPTPAALTHELDVLRAQLEHLTVGLHAVELQRSPMLWNEVVPTLQSLGTIAEVVGAVAAEHSDRSAVLQTSIARFAKCAQGPPLTAISPRVLQALVAGDLLFRQLHRWIRQRWGDVFKLEFILERAHAEYQDAAILTSRRSSRTLQ